MIRGSLGGQPAWRYTCPHQLSSEDKPNRTYQGIYSLASVISLAGGSPTGSLLALSCPTSLWTYPSQIWDQDGQKTNLGIDTLMVEESGSQCKAEGKGSLFLAGEAAAQLHKHCVGRQHELGVGH